MCVSYPPEILNSSTDKSKKLHDKEHNFMELF